MGALKGASPFSSSSTGAEDVVGGALGSTLIVRDVAGLNAVTPGFAAGSFHTQRRVCVIAAVSTLCGACVTLQALEKKNAGREAMVASWRVMALVCARRDRWY